MELKNAAMQNVSAAQKGHETVVAALVAAGADRNAAMSNGATPLLIADHFGHEAVVYALVGADTSPAAQPPAPRPPPSSMVGRTDCVFTVDTLAPADGYLSAKKGETVAILHHEDEWFYGRIGNGEMGWFPIENVR